MQLLDLGSRYPGQIQTVAGRGGQPTLSHLTLTLARVEQAGQYECSPSNTEADTVTVHIVQGQYLDHSTVQYSTVHIVQGQYIMYAQVGLKMIALTLFLNLFFYFLPAADLCHDFSLVDSVEK